MSLLPTRTHQYPAQSPEQSTVESALANCRDWQSKYSYIIKLGKQHGEMPANEKTEHNQLHGCTSNVWLCHDYDAERNSLSFRMDSDAKVIRGLGAVLLEAINGFSAEQIRLFDMEAYFRQLGLIQHLSPSRTNGIKAIMTEIQKVAATQQP